MGWGRLNLNSQFLPIKYSDFVFNLLNVCIDNVFYVNVSSVGVLFSNLFRFKYMVVDRLPRLGMRELICLLSFTCNYVVFVWRGFLFLWVLGMGYVILLWHSLSLPYNYF